MLKFWFFPPVPLCFGTSPSQAANCLPFLKTLGSYKAIKYIKDEIKLIVKSGEKDYAAVICNAQMLRDAGVEIPQKSDAAPEKVEQKSKAKKK